jgi:hypothetical protein
MKPHRVIAMTEHGLLEEYPLMGTRFRLEHAFNDSSLHCFPAAALNDAAELFRA